MANVLLSIIVPTRGRLETLKHTLAALLKLENKDIEILVCDNASVDGTDSYVASISDYRLKYLKSEVPLSMPQNFESGLVNAQGEYILTLGDDDLIIQNNLDEALTVASITNSDLIYWNRWYFYWSSFQDKNIAGTFGISTGSKCFKVDTCALLTFSYYGFLSYQYLPSIYNSIIKRDFLVSYKSSLRGCYFPEYVLSVDVFSSLIFSSLNPSALYLESPVSISGISHRSNGMSVFTDNEEYRKFISESGASESGNLIPANLVGKVNILSQNGKNILGLMVDYYNALEKQLKYSMYSTPSLDLFTKNFVVRLVNNGDINLRDEFKHEFNELSNQFHPPGGEGLNDDPLTYFYKIFGIPFPKLYTGRFNNNDATSLSLFEHLKEINFNKS